MWFEQRVQLVILLVLTLASAASRMSLLLISHLSLSKTKKKVLFLFSETQVMWVMWWCSLVTFGREWAPRSAKLVSCRVRFSVMEMFRAACVMFKMAWYETNQERKWERERESTESNMMRFDRQIARSSSMQQTRFGSKTFFFSFLVLKHFKKSEYMWEEHECSCWRYCFVFLNLFAPK